jgi:hypothetical protein
MGLGELIITRPYIYIYLRTLLVVHPKLTHVENSNVPPNYVIQPVPYQTPTSRFLVVYSPTSL